ncbi:MAG TPA: DUF1569 domain-containing protein [Sphingobacteriaceae bacterium]
MKSIFARKDIEELIDRINCLSPASPGLWGKMTVSQMLAHCNVAYEMTFGDKHPAPNPFVKLMLRLFVKNKVVSDQPHKPNGRTAPAFLVSSEKDFEIEKNRLIRYIQQTQQLGAEHFHMKESPSFGKLTQTEWNKMLYKHLDHHLKQFGV